MSEYMGYICDLNYYLKIHSKILTEATKIETQKYTIVFTMERTFFFKRKDLYHFV